MLRETTTARDQCMIALVPNTGRRTTALRMIAIHVDQDQYQETEWMPRVTTGTPARGLNFPGTIEDGSLEIVSPLHEIIETVITAMLPHHVIVLTRMSVASISVTMRPRCDPHVTAAMAAFRRASVAAAPQQQTAWCLLPALLLVL
jgi:hypothetical protein